MYPQPRRPRTPLVIAVVFAAVAVLVTGGIILYAVGGGTAATKVGDCLVATGDGAKTGDFEHADCAAPDAAYRVVAVKPPSCETPVYAYWSKTATKGPNALYCLTLNAAEGDCFHQEVMFPTGKATKVDCGPSATYEVVKVVDGTADADACGEDVETPHRNEDLTSPMALVYPAPPLTICTEPA